MCTVNLSCWWNIQKRPLHLWRKLQTHLHCVSKMSFNLSAMLASSISMSAECRALPGSGGADWSQTLSMSYASLGEYSSLVFASTRAMGSPLAFSSLPRAMQFLRWPSCCAMQTIAFFNINWVWLKEQSGTMTCWIFSTNVCDFSILKPVLRCNKEFLGIFDTEASSLHRVSNAAPHKYDPSHWPSTGRWERSSHWLQLLRNSPNNLS